MLWDYLQIPITELTTFCTCVAITLAVAWVVVVRWDGIRSGGVELLERERERARERERERMRFLKGWYIALAHRQAWCFADSFILAPTRKSPKVGFILYAVTICDNK